MNPTDSLIARMLRGDLQWPTHGMRGDTFLERAYLHGVTSLLHDTLERSAHAPSLPGTVREALRERTLRAAAVELIRRQELQHLLELMADAGIRPILMKGTALAYSLYAQPSLRERADTDLLVHPDQRERLFQLLRAQGFRQPDAAGGELASSEAAFGKDGSTLALDVHWRISSSPLLSGALEFEALAAQAVPVPALGVHARAPGTADALLLAAIHRAKHHQSPFYAGGVEHRGDRLIWLYDLHLLAPALTGGDCAALVQRTARNRVAGLCLDALRVAREAFATPLPGGLMDALERAASAPEPSMVFLRGGRRALLLAELRALPRWHQRWQLLREHALPPADYMLGKYRTRRRWLLPALYVRRAVRWLVRA